MELENYMRKPTPVQAVQLTEENFLEVANLFNAETVRNEDKRYLRVATGRFQGRGQGQTHMGGRGVEVWISNWIVVWEGDKYLKIFEDEQFRKMFDPAS